MSRRPSNEYICVCVFECERVGNSPAFRWLCWNGSISACATVRVCCVVPVACCRLLPSRRHTDTFPHVMPVVSIVSYSHTPAQTHTSTHINMHMPQCIALWHCLCQYCCYVALFRVCTADRNAKTKQQRKKKTQNKNDNICCRLLGECACLCTYVPL